MLNETQRQAMLAVAREAVADRLAGGSSLLRGQLERGNPAGPLFSPLPSASGVFVTLKRGGELRGCLGTLELRGDLAAQVARCAGDSATRDPRFPPVTVDEAPGMTIEISVLGPLERIDPADPAAIEIGRHGLVVEDGPRRGLLLPQVAVEWGWSREQFLRQTCHKAGLPPDAWQQGARVFRFTAEVFGDTSADH